MSKKNHHSKKIKRKRIKTPIKILIAVLIILLLLFLAARFLAHYYIGKLQYTPEEALLELSEEEIQASLLEEEESEGPDSSDEEISSLEQQMENHLEDDTDALYSEDVFNLLLIGCDSRSQNGRGRSDSMILLSVNRKTEQITMTSIMRDIYAAIPGRSNNRINAAYAYGGGDLLLDTIQSNFKIQTDYYAAVDFYSFVEIIDILDGIDLELSAEEIKVMNGYIRELNRLNNRPETTYQLSTPGLQHVNGTQALAYARVRYVGNADFERTERQRTILTKVFEKAKGTSILKLNDILNTVLPKIKTNMPEKDILSLMLKVPSYLSYDMDTLRIPADGTYQSMRIRGMAVLGIDMEENTRILREKIYGTK